jgi:hypothetical protein
LLGSPANEIPELIRNQCLDFASPHIPEQDSTTTCLKMVVPYAAVAVLRGGSPLRRHERHVDALHKITHRDYRLGILSMLVHRCEGIFYQSFHAPLSFMVGIDELLRCSLFQQFPTQFGSKP